jgi:transketolase C-terminal domain/subunit
MSEKKMIATRDGFGKEIVELGKENPNILVVDIDIGKSCKTGEFRKELPGQYINVGIAEQLPVLPPAVRSPLSSPTRCSGLCVCVR